MEIITEVAPMKAVARATARQGQRIGFVPTMGALHEGHLSLVRAAQQRADVVIVSVFVNPTQFGPHEDFNRYPRDLQTDIALLEREGVQYLFAPSVEAMYPAGYATYVTVEGLADRLCGRSRPGHFRGVTTVVLKLFEIVRPHVACFGQKDAQQLVIIRKMVADLNLDVEIVACPIVREPDGLAMSSRNRYLQPDERQAATILYRSLQHARQMIDSGQRQAAEITAAMRQLIQREPLARIDYIEIVNAQTLDPLTVLEGECLIALAVFVGPARLIDNLVVNVSAA
ncbi:MAG: pantoate--beta-alanine ligase [Acidobacteriota bacterium]|nr:pantoate--beta-alanine ligase [Blastocatellia bacterium]MDW8239830.1 pantoate--beta-alanine ligase [Acidobacteriota bacterium]